jgi:large conductance mechanosensitive channel
MGMLQEFKQFAIKGNVVDMAVGIIIGAAFGKVVTGLVEGVIMPPIGMMVGGVDFTNLAVVLREAEGTKPPVILAYGRFIQTAVDFTIVAFAVFMLVRGMNRLKKEAPPPEPAAPALTKDQQLLEEIRDLLATTRPA